MSYNCDGQFAEDLTYDKNGNILTLKRYGQEENGQPVEWDDLTYTYTANRLQSVTDATNNPEGFSDGNSVGVDYVYDSFGNMTTDKNKGITEIKYNHLNLPTEITFANGKINYTYTATGTKIKKVVTPTGSTAQTTDYLHGFEYENYDLKTFPHPEGYVKKDGANYIYHYIYRDHLGNNRLVYADLNNNGTIEPATEIVEENNYYPFGLKHQGYNNLPGVGYKYKFLNKEYEDSFGLNVTETDFRQYDAAIGRFSVMDALSELAPNYTPYRYGFNNPVFWSDPSGLFETEAAARKFAKENDINDYMITSDGKGRYILTITAGEFAGEQFYEMEVLVIENRDDEGGGGGGSDSNSNKDPGYNKYGMIFSVDGGIERPVTPSRGPRDAQWIDMNILYYWATLLYGPKTKAPYDINYERKKKKKEKQQRYEYETFMAIPKNHSNGLMLIYTTTTKYMTPKEFHNTDWNLVKMTDSIQAVEEIKSQDPDAVIRVIDLRRQK